MGGSSKASTSSSTVQKTTTQTVADYSTGDGTHAAATVTGDGNTITTNTLDAGAVAGGLAVASDSLAAMSDSTGDALDFGRDALAIADASGARAADAMKTSVATVAGFAEANEAGNRDTVKTLSDFAMNLRSDGQQQTGKMMQNIVISIVVAVVVLGGMMAWSNHQGKQA